MNCHICGVIMRAVIGYAPPSWWRTVKPTEAPAATVRNAGSVNVVPTPGLMDPSTLEAQSERLQREVRAATIRNTILANDTVKQVAGVKEFEERARDTLRQLMIRMQQDDDTRRR